MEDLIKFEYGAVSSKFSVLAKDKRTAYAVMLLHYGRSNHMIMLYEPKDVVENDQWFNLFGKISDRLDEIYGGEGEFDKYLELHQQEIAESYKTIERIC